MKYCSTRGQERNLSFKQVLFAGYAKDHGLYMPEEIPVFGEKDLQRLSSLSYTELVYEVAQVFVDKTEIPRDDLKDVIQNSLKKFRIQDVLRIEKLEGGLNIVELFHGSTLTFKDLGLEVVCALLNYFLARSGNHVTVLVGTSGDTGSAAIQGVRGRSNMDIIVLLPKGYCTLTQELQMTTVIEDNVHVYCVEGTSDDLDIPIKQCFGNGDLVTSHDLISINSINWGRIMVQVAHYFYTYFQLCRSVASPVQIVVPTGAAGNITAGCVARMMGLPITLVAGVNVNNIVGRTLDSGDFSVNGKVIRTLAPAMNIQIPYNVERLLYLFSKDTKIVKEIMNEFESNNKVQIPEDIMKKMKTAIVETLTVDDEEIIKTLQKVYHNHHYKLCPHTAVAVAYHYRTESHHHNHRQDTTPKAYIASASPAKFPEALRRAEVPPETSLIDALMSLPTRSLDMKKGDDWYQILVAKIETISKSRSKDVK